ncbi:MAG: NUDIX domain-containing protein [Haliscomenobacter sp.]|nr:NUDIX domain-containing protein [Haliscomenobacter sp.]
MYKIYINDTPLYLIEAAKREDIATPEQEGLLIARYPGAAKFLLNYADMLEKSKRFDSIILYFPDLKKLQEDFLTHYDLIEAAGGLVMTPEQKLLLIFRLDHWDLPKGKIEAGETPEEAAVREVEEETGIAQIERGPLFVITYHTYRIGSGKRCLKRTYWFRMSAPEQPLRLQAEEGIEQALWNNPERMLDDERSRLFYRSIRDLLLRLVQTKDHSSSNSGLI